MVAFGASWGVSLFLFGLALTRLGLAITFAVCLGTSAAVGASRRSSLSIPIWL